VAKRLRLLQVLLCSLGGHRRLVAAVAAGGFALAGTAGLLVVVFGQHHAPEPPLTRASPSRPSTASPSVVGKVSSTVVGPVLTRSVPTSITIAAIGVHSNLLKLGRTAGGALAVPELGLSYNLPGWYQYSPTPGELGPAVIAGHVDSAQDGPAIFYRLGALKRGDSVQIRRTDRRVVTFTVNDVRRYSKNAFPTALVYGNTNHAALRLITCGGPFDAATGSYEDNVIVWASLTSVAAGESG
jgi:LPXTG-site transpeptidase (sortase) family protein